MPKQRASEAIESRQLAQTLQRAKAGEKLSRVEIKAIARYEKRRKEELQVAALESIPQPLLAQLFGVTLKTVREWESEQGMQRNPGLPVTYNLFRVIPWELKRLDKARHGRPLTLTGDPQMDMPDPATGKFTRAQLEYQKHKARIARVDADEREKIVIPLDDAHDILEAFCAPLRESFEVLQRQHGPAALEIVQSAVSRAEKALRDRFGTREKTESATEAAEG